MLVTSYFKILENQLAYRHQQACNWLTVISRPAVGLPSSAGLQLAYRHQQACNWLTVISRPAGLPSPAGLQVYRHQQACKMEKIIT